MKSMLTSRRCGDLSTDGGSLVWSSYLGGGGPGIGGQAWGEAVSLAPDGGPVVVGHTSQSDFPTTPGVVQPQFPGTGAQFNPFVTRFHPSGASLVYSTFLATPFTDFGKDVFVDGGGRAWVVGSTNGNTFPVTADAFDPASNGNTDIFFSILARDGKSLVYSTYLGASNPDDGEGIAVRDGRVAIVGSSFGPGYPTTPQSFQPTFQGGQADAVVTVLGFPRVDSEDTASGIPRHSGNPIVLNATATEDGRIQVVCTGVPAGAVGVLLVHVARPPSSNGKRSEVLNPHTAAAILPLHTDASGMARIDFPADPTWVGGTVALQCTFRQPAHGAVHSEIATLSLR